MESRRDEVAPGLAYVLALSELKVIQVRELLAMQALAKDVLALFKYRAPGARNGGDS